MFVAADKTVAAVTPSAIVGERPMVLAFTGYTDQGTHTTPVAAAGFARWSGWRRPRRMSASISRSRSSIPRNRIPGVDVRGAEACERQTTNEAALRGRNIALLSGIIQCTGSRGEFDSSKRAENIKISRRWESHRTNEWRSISFGG